MFISTSLDVCSFCFISLYSYRPLRDLHSFPTRRSSDLTADGNDVWALSTSGVLHLPMGRLFEFPILMPETTAVRSEEHTSELQSRPHLVCRLLLEKKNDHIYHESAQLLVRPTHTVVVLQ